MKPMNLRVWTGAFLLLALSADAATTLIPGILKRETWLGATRAQVEAGSLAASNAIVTYPNVWDVNDGTQNYSSRYSGVVIPDTTGDYDFFLAADDDTDLFISTNDQPAGKYMIAQEDQWSGVRNWTSSTASINAQKNSATWTNAGSGGLAPYAAGIHLVAGTRYYLEGAHHGGGGGNNFAVTMVSHGSSPIDGDLTVLTNALIGLVIPTPTTLSFSTHPSNTTAYVGMAGRFKVTTTTDSQVAPSYQWRRGGVPITNATGPGFSIIASSADNGVQFDCIARVPGLGTPVLSVTSAVATLTVPASGALTVSGSLKRELFLGMTETAAGGVRTALAAGNNGTPSSISAITSLDTPTAGANYGERVSGYYTPSVSGRYVFFVASDDDSDLYVSTNDQPSGKQLVAQETVWSANRAWNSSGGGSSLTQKRSDQWVPDPNNPITPPYGGGIALSAGTRYYLEAVHRAGTGGNGLSATFGLTNEVLIGIPIDDSGSLFTNGVISYTTRPVTTFAITTQPANITVFEGFNYSFQVVVQTDSEIAPTYQWRKNGTPVTGATGNSYSTLAAFADNNSHFSCDIAIAGVTNTTSTTNTVTIQQGVVAVGQVRREIWTNIPSSGVTRALVEANAPGTVPTPDVTTFVSGFDVNGFGQNDYVQRLSGLFIPTVTTNYVFYFSSDDDGSLYLGTNDRPETKQRIAFEPNWSGFRSWISAGNGSPADVAQKCSTTFVDPTSGLPGPGNPNGILLTAGNRYYVEIVMHQAGGGDPCGATYIFFGANPPANGTASVLTGSKVGVLVPAATIQNFTLNPQNATVAQCQPVFFSAAATNDSIVPSTYQWRRNGTNIPGAVFGTTGFITSSNDNGATFDCVATAPAGGLLKTGTVATLTISSGASLVVGSISQERWDSPLATRQGIESGSLGYANSNSVRPNIDYGFEGNNFGNRIRGFFIPPVSTNYVFFIASDDDSYLYLSPDDQPSRKVWIANESGWATGQRAWQGAAGGGLNSQKRSDTFTPDGGLTFPGNPGGVGGIPLVAGGKYYLEYVHHEGGGGDFAGVTYSVAGEPDPLGGDPSILTNTVIAHLEATPRPVLTARRSGNSLIVSWSPAGGTLVSTPVLPAVTWTTLSTTNPATIPIAPGNLFMRVQVP